LNGKKGHSTVVMGDWLMAVRLGVQLGRVRRYNLIQDDDPPRDEHVQHLLAFLFNQRDLTLTV